MCQFFIRAIVSMLSTCNHLGEAVPAETTKAHQINVLYFITALTEMLAKTPKGTSLQVKYDMFQYIAIVPSILIRAFCFENILIMRCMKWQTCLVQSTDKRW
jgi:hypothetical protein